MKNPDSLLKNVDLIIKHSDSSKRKKKRKATKRKDFSQKRFKEAAVGTFFFV